MNKQITRIVLDVSLRDSYKVVFAKVNDSARRIIAEIQDNGEEYSLADVSNVIVRCRKADGKQVTKNAVKENDNTVIIDIDGQMTTCAGTAVTDIMLCGADDSILSTAKFYLNVDTGAVDEDEIKSSNEYQNIIKALKDVGLATEVAKTALNTSDKALEKAHEAMEEIPGFTDRAERAAEAAANSKTEAGKSAKTATEASQKIETVKEEAVEAVKIAEEEATKKVLSLVNNITFSIDPADNGLNITITTQEE